MSRDHDPVQPNETGYNLLDGVADADAGLDNVVRGSGGIKGRTNKNLSQLAKRELMKQLRDNNCDPIQFMINMVNGMSVKGRSPSVKYAKELTLELRFAAAKELTSYILPKLRSIEIKPSDELLAGGVAVIKFSDMKKANQPIDVGENHDSSNNEITAGREGASDSSPASEGQPLPPDNNRSLERT